MADQTPVRTNPETYERVALVAAFEGIDIKDAYDQAARQWLASKQVPDEFAENFGHVRRFVRARKRHPITQKETAGSK